MYYSAKSKYQAMHTDTVKVNNNKQSSTLLQSLQSCNNTKQQACLCSTTTSTSHIQTNIYLQQHSSRSNGYFTNISDHMINNNTSHQLYSQHSYLDSVHTNNNMNGLLEPSHHHHHHDDNSFSDYSTSIPSGGAEQILMILMCNGMTPEFDQFNGKFNSSTHNRLRIENSSTSSSNGTTPSSSSSTTPSSSVSSPNCNDNLKVHIDTTSTNNQISEEEEEDIYCTITANHSELNNNHHKDQYLSESSNKLDENLTLPPSPCVSELSESDQVKNPEEMIFTEQEHTTTTTTTEHNLIPNKIESGLHASTELCLISDPHHGETTDESSEDEEKETPKEKKPKRESKHKDQQKVMKPELSLDSAESSGFTIKPARSYSFRDATIFVLSQLARPMTAVDITKYIFENKMVKSAGKTPERTVAAMIYQEMKKKRNTSEFALFGSGLFGLSAWKSDDHTSQDTASVSTDASLSSHKSVDRTEKKKKEKKKRKLTKPEPEKEELSEDSDNDIPISRRKPRRMHKHIPSSSNDQEVSSSVTDSEETSCKKRKQNEEPIVTEEVLFKTYISKLKKKEKEQSDEDECFVCKNGGDLICCDYSGCTKVYHASCVGLPEVPKGDWICPHHYCAECKKKSFRSKASKKCYACPYGVCGEHASLLTDKIDREKYVCAKCKPLCEHIK